MTPAQNPPPYRDMQLADLSPQQLRKAADLKERIDALQDQLDELVGAVEAAPTEAPAAPGIASRRRRKKRSRGRPAPRVPLAETRRFRPKAGGELSAKAAILKVLASGKVMSKNEIIERVSALQGGNINAESLHSRLYEMKTKDKTIVSPESGVYRLK